MSTKSIPVLILLILFEGLVRGQSPEFTAPMSGVVYDAPTQGLRPVLGRPGGAYLGQALMSGIDLGSVSPNGRTALVLIAGETQLVRGMERLRADAEILSGAIEGWTRIAWAGDSSAAVLYSPTRRSLQVVRGLKDTAAGEPEIDLSGIDGQVSALVTDQTARRIAIGITGASAGWYLVEGSTVQFLFAMEEPASGVFADGGSTLHAVGVRGQLAEMRNLSEGRELISEVKEGLEDPAGVGISADGKLLYIAERSRSLLRIQERAGGALVSEIAVDEPPTGLELLGSGIFLLRGRARAGEPLYLFEGGAEPAVYFVPASPEAPAEGEKN